MRWEDLPESGNVEDRRGGDDGGFGGGGGGGFGGGIPGGAGGLSIGTILILGLIGYATGIDPGMLIRGVETFNRTQQPRVDRQQPPQQQKRTTPAPQDEMGRFVVRVLGSTEATWKEIFAREAMAQYRPPVLVLYNQVTRASCGGRADARMGPFYCPADQRIYLDTSFFKMIESRFKGCDVGSPACRFAQAYVVAHEVGHHVQNLFGVLQKSQQAQQSVRSKAEANRIQVRVELQADCFSGIWANRNERSLDPGDIEAALRTAAAIGDDALQRSAGGRVVPDSFTHGSSEQRQRWFTAGFKQGTVASCNTFSATSKL